MITLGSGIHDNINRIITLTNAFYLQLFSKWDLSTVITHKRLITLIVITLSDFHCIVKRQRIAAINACIDRLWQLGFSDNLDYFKGIVR